MKGILCLLIGISSFFQPTIAQDRNEEVFVQYFFCNIDSLSEDPSEVLDPEKCPDDHVILRTYAARELMIQHNKGENRNFKMDVLGQKLHQYLRDEHQSTSAQPILLDQVKYNANTSFLYSFKTQKGEERRVIMVVAL